MFEHLLIATGGQRVAPKALVSLDIQALVSTILFLPLRAMCYFDQTRWKCGYWKWGHFRQQCNKEYRMGETCGLKLVYETKEEPENCKLCSDLSKKQRRYDKMYRDVDRWQQEGNRSATIERTCGEMQEVLNQIFRLKEDHDTRLQTLGSQV